MTDQTQHPIEFDVTEGRWRVTATYASEDNITVYLNGEEWRTYTFPAYKIWNIPAHLDEYVAMLDRKLAVEEAEESISSVEEAREIWERQSDEDPVRVEAAGRILTAAGWQ